MDARLQSWFTQLERILYAVWSWGHLHQKHLGKLNRNGLPESTSQQTRWVNSETQVGQNNLRQEGGIMTHESLDFSFSTDHFIFVPKRQGVYTQSLSKTEGQGTEILCLHAVTEVSVVILGPGA